VSDAARQVRVHKSTLRTSDLVAHEAPLELQLDGHSLAVVMRTPGHDEELALGFLLTGGLIGPVDDVVRLKHCTQVPTPEAEDNGLQLRLRVPFDLARVRRHFFATSSCGVCGKATIENALKVGKKLEPGLQVEQRTLTTLPALLRAGQAAFDETGGLHAAGLFAAGGELCVLREDVGRHNAVDKVIGWSMRAKPDAPVLMVSGRLSFELVQKCVAARIPVLAGISAPTSLAVDMAEALGVTLVGFLRGESMNVYSHPERLT